MNKCPKCGTEFEGRFCPECGERAPGQKLCPECGAYVNETAKFCNECGYSFERGEPTKIMRSESNARKSAKKIERKEASGAVRAAYTVAGRATALMFVLFSIMALGFCAAPVAVVNSLFGGAAESLGSVYSMYDGILLQVPELRSEVYSIVIIVAVQAAVAILTAFVRIFPRTRDIEVKSLRAPIGSVFAYSSFPFYIALLIVSAVVMSRISALDEGMGLLAVGTCPKLLLSFAVVFFVLALAAEIARRMIGKTYPELPSAEAAERAERRKKYAPKLTVIPGEVKRVPFLRYVEQNVKLSRAVNAALFIAAAATVVCSALLLQALGGNYSMVRPVVSPHWIAAAELALIAVAVLASYAAPVKDFSPEEFAEKIGRKKPRKNDKGAKHVAALVLYFIVWVVYAYFTVSSYFMYDFVYRAYIIFAVYSLLVGIGFIILYSAIDKRNRAISTYLFGTVAPLKTSVSVVDYDVEIEKRALEKYKAAVKQKCAPTETDESAARSVKRRRIKLGSSAAAICVFSIVAAIAMPLSVDKFSSGYVGSMPFTYNHSIVMFMFGEADEVTETKLDEGSDYVRTTYEHFGGEFKKLYSKLKDVEKNAEQAMEAGELDKVATYAKQAAELEAQLSTLPHDYLKIVTVDDREGVRVEEIILEKGRQLARPTAKKTVERVEISQKRFLLYDNVFGVNVEFKSFYTDGSFEYSSVPHESLMSSDMSKTGGSKLYWSDAWGEYSADTEIVNQIGGRNNDYVGSIGSRSESFEYSLTVDEAASTPESPKLELSLYNGKPGSDGEFYWYVPQWKKYIGSVTSIKFDASFTRKAILSILEQKDCANIEYTEVGEYNAECSTADGALYDKNKTELIFVPRGYADADFAIPNTVKRICAGAFGSKYTDFNDPMSYSSNIENVLIPNSVVEIDGEAFLNFYTRLKIYAQSASKPTGWKNVEFYTVFGSDLKKHDYCFEPNGGAAVDAFNGVYSVDELPVQQKSGYLFGGWYDNAALDGEPVSAPYCNDRDTTLYAKWISEDEYIGDGASLLSAIKVDKKERHEGYAGEIYYTSYYIGASSDISTCWYVYVSDYDGDLSVSCSDAHAKIYTFEGGTLRFDKYNYQSCDVKGRQVYYIAVSPNSHVIFNFYPRSGGIM